MRFFHISDLHIGKQLHHYSLKEEQTAVLKEILAYAVELKPEAVVIAGDIYDKSVPSAEAVTIFDEFLTELSEIEPAISVLIISGNHDSQERLKYASSFLRKHHIYVACTVPEKEEEHIEKVTFTDQWGEIDFYLLPFFKPSYVRGIWPEQPPQTYDEAVRRIIAREGIDDTRRNVLVSHQFYTGGGKNPEICDSETVSVGGIDNVDIAAVELFDYTALGHLHGAQTVGRSHIRYCGTPLKYSVSECGHEKTLTVVEINEKENGAQLTFLPFHPLRDVKKIRGELAQVLSLVPEGKEDNYVSITLTDESALYKPKEQLEEVYCHILEVKLDNTRVRKKLEESNEDIDLKPPIEAFSDFYKEMQGKDMNETEYDIMCHVIDRVKGD